MLTPQTPSLAYIFELLEEHSMQDWQNTKPPLEEKMGHQPYLYTSPKYIQTKNHYLKPLLLRGNKVQYRNTHQRSCGD